MRHFVFDLVPIKPIHYGGNLMKALAEPIGMGNCGMTNDLLRRVIGRRAGRPAVRPEMERIEQRIANCVETFRFISELNETWREDVFRGRVEYNKEQDESIKSLFEELISGGRTISESHELIGLSPFWMESLEDCLRKANDIFTNWQAPTLSLAPGLREFRLDRDQTREIRDFLNSHKT
jgi:hypothetical protein